MLKSVAVSAELQTEYVSDSCRGVVCINRDTLTLPKSWSIADANYIDIFTRGFLLYSINNVLYSERWTHFHLRLMCLRERFNSLKYRSSYRIICFHAGYYPLVTVPAGATSITVREDAVSSNYIGKRPTGVTHLYYIGSALKIIITCFWKPAWFYGKFLLLFHYSAVTTMDDEITACGFAYTWMPSQWGSSLHQAIYVKKFCLWFAQVGDNNKATVLKCLYCVTLRYVTVECSFYSMCKLRYRFRN